MRTMIAVSPCSLAGTFHAPPSKSIAHRALLCAALAKGDTVIKNVSDCDDVLATRMAIKTLGATIKSEDSSVKVCGLTRKTCLNGEEFYCNESASTLRFLLPILLAIGGNFSVSGSERLLNRPLQDYFCIFEKQGIEVSQKDGKIFLSGKLTSGTFSLTGNVSSQFITGLLLALPTLSGDSEIEITTEVTSRGYIDLTLDVMQKFGVNATHSPDYKHFYVKGNQVYTPTEVVVEGDYSQAAFFMVLNALGSHVTVNGLNPDTKQGDKKISELIKKITENKSERMIDVSDVPDLVPVLCVLAAKTEGITKFVNAKRLRLKESDRLRAIATELTKLGAHIIEFPDCLEIHGVSSFSGGRVDSFSDHRIAMALAVAGTVSDGEVIIDGAECVKKSYPDFWKTYEMLGGVIKKCQQPLEPYSE